MLTAKELAAERRLIEASQRDLRRFAQLYERYFDRVYAFALTCTGDHTAASLLIRAEDDSYLEELRENVLAMVAVGVLTDADLRRRMWEEFEGGD